MMGAEKQIRIGRLNNLGGILREMARVYKLARRREIETADASRLVGILTQLRNCVEAGDLERRITELESRYQLKAGTL